MKYSNDRQASNAKASRKTWGWSQQMRMTKGELIRGTTTTTKSRASLHNGALSALTPVRAVLQQYSGNYPEQWDEMTSAAGSQYVEATDLNLPQEVASLQKRNTHWKWHKTCKYQRSWRKECRAIADGRRTHLGALRMISRQYASKFGAYTTRHERCER
jgi:hypothetical protein